jgi:SNF2 family DNA or RNA helicase
VAIAQWNDWNIYTGGKEHKKYQRPRDFIKFDDNNPIEPFKIGYTLHPYQLIGVNWLAYNWHQGRSCILADEMGLGKTVQIIAFCRYLYLKQNLKGPFLVLAPLSTLAHWQRHFSTWWSGVNAVIYHGTEKARKIILRSNGWNVDVPITSHYRQGPKKGKKRGPKKKHLTGNAYYAAKAKKNFYYQDMGKKGGRPRIYNRIEQ